MKINRRNLLIYGSTALAGCVAAGHSSSVRSDMARDQVQEAESIVREYDLPGMTVAIATPVGIVAREAGHANRETGELMSSATTMLAASIGKTFVSATLLQFADEGRIDLDDPIAKWLGKRSWYDRLPNGQGITVRHLLQHRSGLPDHVHMEAFRVMWTERDEAVTPEDLIALTFGTRPLFPPGTSWSYTDTGYLLLGLVIEDIAGRTYYEEIDERFIVPLGLSATGPSNRRSLPGLARGYASVGSGLGLPDKTTGDDGAMLWSPAIEWTGGGLYSTSSDLARWGRSFLSGKLVSAQVFNDAVSGTVASENDPESLYGLGIAIRTRSAFGPVLGHRGWIPGYVSSLQYYPVHDTAIAFQINTDIGIVGVDRPVMLEIEERLARRLLSRKGRWK